MIPADLAFALLINRTSQFYQASPPVYMTYDEFTHVSAPSLGRTQDINRSIAVRVADNYAVMKDLPNGGERIGQAFPVVAYFDPFSSFRFGYFANLKRVDIMMETGTPFTISTPEPDPSVNAVIPYFSSLDVTYAPDSTENAVHLSIAPTPRLRHGVFYFTDIVEDPQSQLPSHVAMHNDDGNETITLDFKVLDGHWVIVHGTFSAPERVAFLTFDVIADVTFKNIAFPSEAPDPRLAGTPTPSPVPSPSASPSGS